MSQYEIRDLGKVSYSLGIRIDYNEQNMKLSQETYKRLLNEYNINECNITKTPVELSIKLSKHDSSDECEKEEMKNVPYRQLIGSLMYVALATRPDILCITTKLSQFVSNPGKTLDAG